MKIEIDRIIKDKNEYFMWIKELELYHFIKITQEIYEKLKKIGVNETKWQSKNQIKE